MTNRIPVDQRAGLTTKECSQITQLRRRLQHLADRTRGNPHLTYDRQEIGGLLWALDLMEAERQRRLEESA